MHVISRKILRKFWEKHPEAEQSLQAWYIDAKHANWKKPSDIKAIHKTASLLANDRVVFNIKGNQYRIIVVVEYRYGSIYIRFVGTHSEYDRIDATKI